MSLYSTIKKQEHFADLYELTAANIGECLENMHIMNYEIHNKFVETVNHINGNAHLSLVYACQRLD